MWSSTLTVYIILVTFCFDGIFAGRYDVRKRDYYSVQHDVVVTEQVDVVVQENGTVVTSSPKAVETANYIGAASLVVEAPTPTTSTVADTPIDAGKIETGEENSSPTANDEPEPLADEEEDEATSDKADPPIESPLPDSQLTEVETPKTEEVVPAPPTRAQLNEFTQTDSTPSSVTITPESEAVSHELESPDVFPDIKPEIVIPSEDASKNLSNKVTTAGKRGIAYNDSQKLGAFSASSKVSWAYNWGSSTTSIPQQYEYVPMLWGLGRFTDGWSNAADKAIASGSKHILAFNEPDLAEQSSLGVFQAADGYRRYIQPYAGKAKLGSPAVTNGGAPMGLTYLAAFLTACADCTIDFIAIHWYNGGNAQDFKDYVTRAHILGGGRPVWITEFEASGSPSQQQTFLNDVLPWLDSQNFVERYAYFMASDGNLISSGTSLSTVGQAFAFD